jgi:hypothetical protein
MAGTTCQNCGAAMSCSCQKRTASNGASACSNCVSALNAKITAAKTDTTLQTLRSPSNQWGANRYKTN